MNQSVTVAYCLRNKERIFDLGQGIHANRSYILRKRGGTVQPYTGLLQKMKLQMVAFFLLAAVQAVLIALSGPSVGKVLLLALTILCGAVTWYVRKSGRQSYDRALALYLKNTGEGGTITINEEGITERSEAGVETDFTWREYVGCVICPEAIVVLSTRPVLLILCRMDETEQGLRAALEAWGEEDTVYEVSVREKRQ